MSLRATLDKLFDRSSTGEEIEDILDELTGAEISTRDDADAVCDWLTRYPWAPFEKHEYDLVLTPLRCLAGLFQEVISEEPFEALQRRGIPELIRIFWLEAENPGSDESDVLFLLKILAIYGTPDGADTVAAAVRRNILPDGFLWSVVFNAFVDDHPDAVRLCQTIAGHLPTEGFLPITYLDFCNQLALSSRIKTHPFDSQVGLGLLRQWLENESDDEYSYAHSATVALVFLDSAERDRLLDLALMHPDFRVRIEAAWVEARIGRDDGIRKLAEHCLDPRLGESPRRYLEELGRFDAVPVQARDPRFRASCELSEWLAHPNEHGAPPDTIELLDEREAVWPPTHDTRPLRLFTYVYRAGQEDGSDLLGVGMTGSITFSLFGVLVDDLSPEDIYALHCCWELITLGDSRAPEQPSVEAGRRILAEAGWPV